VLGKEAGDITVGDILRAVEGSLEPVECISLELCPIRAACGSRQTWVELYREISACVDSLSLGGLARAYKTMDQMEYMI
jgi:DNA-binding IscR family transcriptional regulator